MSRPRTFIFDIQGEFSRSQDYNDNNVESDSFERKIIQNLSGYSSEINLEIKNRIRNEIFNHVGEKIKIDIDVDINYRKGSIGFFGFALITIDWMAKLGSVITFVVFLRTLIRNLVQEILFRYIRRRIPRNYLYRPSVIVRPSNVEHVKEDIYELPSKLKSFSQPFSLSTILIAITLANLIMFIGGSVYNFVSISSIQSRHNDATKIISETRQKYQDTINNIIESEVKSKSELDNIVSNFNNKIVTITNDLNKKYDSTQLKIDSLKNEADLLSKQLYEKTKITAGLNSRLMELEKNNFKMNFSHLWNFSNRYLKILIFILLASCLLNVFFIVYYFINKKFF